MPQYPSTFPRESCPKMVHRLLVLIEETHDVLTEVASVKELDYQQSPRVVFGDIPPKNRFAPMTVSFKDRDYRILLRSVIPSDLPKSFQCVIKNMTNLQHIADDEELAIKTITKRRPRFSERRHVELRPRTAKAYDFLRQHASETGIPDCRRLLLQKFPDGSGHLLDHLHHHGLVWKHPLVDLTFVDTKARIDVKEVVVY